MDQFLINDLKISSRLYAGFGLLLLLVILLGGMALQSIVTLTATMNRFTDHPLQVIDETQQAKTNIVIIQRDIRDLTRSDRLEAPEVLERNIAKMGRELDTHLEVVRSQYLGPAEDVTQLMRALTNWRRLLDEALVLEKAGDQAATILKYEPERRRYAMEVEAKFQDILDFARAKAKSLRESADAEKNRIYNRLAAALAGLVIFGIFGTRYLTRSITQPLTELRRRMADLAAGANEYLSKPVDIDDLMVMMRQCLVD